MKKLIALLILVASFVTLAEPPASAAQSTCEPMPLDPWTSNLDARVLQETAEEEYDYLMRQVDKVSKEEKTALRLQLRQASFQFAKSKQFFTAKAKILFFEVPDAVLFDLMIRAVKYRVIYPMLYASGHGALIAALEVLPEAALLTLPYVALRLWINKIHLRHRIGIDPNELRSSLVEDFDLNNTKVYTLDIDGETLLFPVTDEVRNMVKEAVAVHDHVWLEELVRRNPDPAVADALLVKKGLDTPEVRDQILTKAVHEINTSAPEALSFYLQAENLIDRLRGESEEMAPNIMGIRSLSAFAAWVKSHWFKFVIAREATKIRIFQLQTAAEYIKSDRGPEARKRLKDATIELRGKRTTVLLQKLRTMKEQMPVPRCQAIFGVVPKFKLNAGE